jgi:membrane protease YdiL (CAAX protease family)
VAAELSPAKRTAALVVVPAVAASMRLAFPALATRLGRRRGYFVAFLCYWLGWCLLVPLWVLGPARLRRLFPGRRPAGREWLALAAPPALGFVAAFPRQVRRADVATLVGSAALAVVNATAEEVLWRGVYRDAFPDDRRLGLWYPAVGFGLWHVAPQAVFPNPRPGGAASLVAVAGLVGLLYGWVARRTGGIGWTTVSHVLFDFSGLGALIYRDRR